MISSPDKSTSKKESASGYNERIRVAEARKASARFHRKLGVGKGGEWRPLSFMYGEEFAPPYINSSPTGLPFLESARLHFPVYDCLKLDPYRLGFTNDVRHIAFAFRLGNYRLVLLTCTHRGCFFAPVRGDFRFRSDVCLEVVRWSVLYSTHWLNPFRPV